VSIIHASLPHILNAFSRLYPCLGIEKHHISSLCVFYVQTARMMRALNILSAIVVLKMGSRRINSFFIYKHLRNIISCDCFCEIQFLKHTHNDESSCSYVTLQRDN
jgi:hypothetical protein